MTKAEEIEAYIAERKKEYSESISYYILKEEREGKLIDEDMESLSRCDARIRLLEQIGSTFFNWE